MLGQEVLGKMHLSVDDQKKSSNAQDIVCELQILILTF